MDFLFQDHLLVVDGVLEPRMNTICGSLSGVQFVF